MTLRLGVTSVVLWLAGCATPDTPCCLAVTDGGTGCVQRADVPPGAGLARRFVQLGVGDCEKKVCVSDDSVAGTTVELKGYCSVQCVPGGSCPGSRLGPMECQQLTDAAEDGGLAVCVRRTDAGAL